MSEEDHKGKWDLFIAGDSEAYGWLYRTYVEQLYRYGLRFTRDGEVVKDCIQELFTTIYKNRKKLSLKGSVRVYLMVALRNNIVRALQRQARYVDSPDHEAFPFSLSPTVEDAYVERETEQATREQFERILSLLSARQQEIIYYRYIEGMSIDEICVVMSLNYQSALNLIQRSRKKIREVYGK